MRLILFDMDGTLIDSQAHIVASMDRAFQSLGFAAPSRAATLGIVGLSLPQAMYRLAPDQTPDVRDQLTDSYKASFMKIRSEGHVSPMYPGALDCLNTLRADPDTVLGIATGKSRRGLRAVFDQHPIADFFVTTQVADDHPSKPHPAMAQAALLESGADWGVMVGDTTFDMEMGRSAGMCALGVTWGYHSKTMLAEHAEALCDDFSSVVPTLNDMRPV